MSNDEKIFPRLYPGVMVSSTFKDLEKHRAVLMDALNKEELHAIGMEDYVPTPEDDVISSSLNMVRKGSAYIGLVSHRCGQVSECPKRNPLNYSITRLEFEEAQRLGLPTLIFVMSEDHDVKPRDVETDPAKKGKLNEFRNAAKAGRIYISFKSLADFTSQAIHAVAQLRRHIDEEKARVVEAGTKRAKTFSPIPAPPAIYAEPPYIGSHKFIGRKAQLDVLNDWAGAADPHPVLLFDAIGGSGKSMLTWEWTTKHAYLTRNDWAGRFWYSFYEKGDVQIIMVSGFDFANRGHSPQLQLVKPNILRTLNERTTQLVVGVSRVPTARSFEAQVRIGQGPWQAAGTFPQARRMVLKELVPGTLYAIRVRAIGGSTGYSDWSDPVSHMCM